MAALVFKVFTLALKTASKPLAARFQSAVLQHPSMRQSVLKVAQVLHRIDVTINRRVEGKSGKAFVGEMQEEQALELAAKVASEGFVFAFAVGLLGLEYARSARNDKAKKEKEEAYRRQVDGLHEQHLRAEQEVREQTREMAVILASAVQRLERLEEQIQATEAPPPPPANGFWSWASKPHVD